MKRVVILLTVMLTGSAAAQPERRTDGPAGRRVMLNKEWIGPVGEYLKIANDTALITTPFSNGKYPCRLDGNLLIFVHGSYSSERGAFADYDSFRVEGLSKDSLVLTALNQGAFETMKKNAFERMTTPASLVFVNRRALDDPNLSFEKVYFSTGGGMAMGWYRMIELEIDSSGNLLFSCLPGTKQVTGTFKGRVSPAEVKHINELIRKSIPARYAAIPWHAEDAGSRAIRVYYNGKMKETTDRGVPYLANDLQAYLGGFVGQVQLEKVSDKYGLTW